MKEKLPPNEPRDTPFNQCLASACSLKGAACCRKGRIFLPDEELERIREWLHGRPEDERANFERCVDDGHDGFALLDQESRCQFLDDENLCRLHDAGAKPTECFWWPLHVYSGDDGDLEIRVSESCCDAHLCLGGDAEGELRSVESAARRIGFHLIRRFRRIYSGSYKTRFLRRVGP